MPELESSAEPLEARNWTEVRCFNIPVNAQMLMPGGFVRELTCNLKTECPRNVRSKTRLVTFDKAYVLSKLNEIKDKLDLTPQSLAELLQ